MNKKLCYSIGSIVLAGLMIFGACSTVETPDVSSVQFESVVTTYDGSTQKIEVSELPSGVTVEYENNEHKDAGNYEATATLYASGKKIKTLEATLSINPRNAEVKIDDKESMIDDMEELTYTVVSGLLDGDDLGIELTVDNSDSGVKQIVAEYANKNYNVNFTGGKYLISEYLFDSSDMKNYASAFMPNYAPFSLYDTSYFSNSVVTSISFPYYGLSSGYTISSDNLYMPVYVVKSDFSTAQNECTVENGKKINLDFTGKLDGVQSGDWLTVDNLHIEIGADETLAFGDSSMAVLPMFLRNDGTYGFWNRIFGSKGQNNHSLIFKIVGYNTASDTKGLASADDGISYISFLGDSISTYSNWSNNAYYNNTIASNVIWYPNNNYAGANLGVEETWWYKTFTSIDYSLCVNNSWSGSVVTTSQTYNVRAKNLHNTTTGAVPDIVVILMGVNDYAAGTALGTYNGTTVAPQSPTTFSEAYGRTVTNILDTYEDVEIFCCSFLPDRKRFSGSTNGNGVSENDYNDAIRTIASNLGVNFIDLYNDSGITPQNIAQFTTDRLHPNATGMEMMKNTVVSAINAA